LLGVQKICAIAIPTTKKCPHQGGLANEIIEQEAKISVHSDAGDVHIIYNSEPAPPDSRKALQGITN